MTNDVNKYLYWAPRLMAITFILFLFSFSFDVFDPALTIFEMIIGFFIHNIPVIILSILLSISWKHEGVGAVTFITAGFLYMMLVILSGRFEWYMLSWSAIISGPAFIIGFLFLKNWKIKRGQKKHKNVNHFLSSKL